MTFNSEIEGVASTLLITDDRETDGEDMDKTLHQMLLAPLA
jgi:hypothetical protein